uniref:Uncharacterized protein n=1 Tax=Micrurus lemniscatus lemniscatus TaxID=129467 RepID=A0A2D4IIQ6_MICLE
MQRGLDPKVILQNLKHIEGRSSHLARSYPEHLPDMLDFNSQNLGSTISAHLARRRMAMDLRESLLKVIETWLSSYHCLQSWSLCREGLNNLAILAAKNSRS